MTDLIPNTHVKLEADNGTGTWPTQLTKVGVITVTRGDAEPGVITAEVADASVDPVTSTALRTNKPVRLRVANGVGGWATVAQGKVDEPSTDYDPRPGAKTPVKVRFNAIDAVRDLQGIPEARGVGTMAQLKRLLNGTGIPFKINGSSTPDAADPTIVATNPNASLWDQILITRDSLLGYAWVDKENVLNAYDQASMPGASVATLGPSVYTDIDLDFAVEQIINTVTVNWRRYDIGTEDSADVPYGPYDDGPSVIAWGNRTAEFTIQGATEVEADIISFADEVLARNADAEVRPKTMVIPIETVADLAYVRNIDINSRVTVVYPDGVTSKVMRVSGINHQINARTDQQRPLVWFMTLTFALPNGVSMPSKTPDTGNNVTPDNVVTDDELDAVDNNLQDQVDELLDEHNDLADFVETKNTVYRQTTKPTIDGVPGRVYRVGDIWFDIDDGNRIYLYVAGGTNDFVDAKTSYLATPNGKLLVTPLGLYCYDAGMNLKFFLDAGTGAITMAGALLSAGDINGATVTGGTVQSTSTTNRGIKLNSTFLICYDGSGNPTLSINASTGAITMKGDLTSGSTITGALFQTNTSGQRIRIRGDLSAGVIEWFSGVSGETAGVFNPAAVGSKPTLELINGKNGTYTDAPRIFMQSGTGSQRAAHLTAGSDSYLAFCADNIVLHADDIDLNGPVGITEDLTVDEGAIISGSLHATNVYVDSEGGTGFQAAQLASDGRIDRNTSSRRFKDDIEPLTLDEARKLYRLESVTFTRNDDPDDVTYPGVIAEQAAEAGLDLWVTYDREGEVQGFRYQELAAGLLVLVRDQADRIDTLEQQVKGLLEILNAAEGGPSDG